MSHMKFVAGLGRFTEDLAGNDDLWMMILRAPVAHARLTGLDPAAALAVPGVRHVVTADDLAALGIGPMPQAARVIQPDGTPMAEPPRPVLPADKIAFLGQPIAAVIATTAAAAQDGIEAIALDFEELAPVLNVETAASAPQIWPGIPNNRAFIWEKGDADAVEAACARAATVVTLRVEHPRLSVAPIETRAAIAAYDPATDGYELITPSQGVVALRRQLSATLGIPQTSLRVRTPDVGGSFAVKIFPYPEQVLALVAARISGARVRWVASRGESLQSDVIGRGRVDHAALACDKAGRILAFRIKAHADMGAFLSTVAPATVTAGSVRVLNQAYAVPAMHFATEGMITTQAPTDAYRGAGKPEGAATLERLLDLAARELGIDPLEIRRRNLIRPEDLPHATAMGESIDSGDYPALAARLAADADWAGFAIRRHESAARGCLRGRGVGFHIHATGGSTAERSEVTALPDGRVRVRTGAQDSGQSHRESLALIAAEALDLPVSAIRVEQGDSAYLETGGGSGGSNLLSVAGNTVHRTAKEMLNAARAQAEAALEAAAADLTYGAGRFSIVGTDRGVTLAELAADEDTPACAAACDFEGNHWTFPSGGFAVEIEVDPETGALRIDRITGIADLGRIINPPAALGQIHGGIGQAIGEVFLEALIADADGQLLTGSLMDYALPRAADMPMIQLATHATDSPASLLGVKGVGELPSIGAPGVLMNAVLDALAAFGVDHIDKPITPARIWEALSGAGVRRP